MIVIWLYVATATLLIVHEIDSAYWHEWELFRLPGGLPLFLCLHIPLVAAILYGLLLLERGHPAGSVLALVLAGGGIFAFAIHLFFIARGRPEFRAPASIAILVATLLSSIGLSITTLQAVCSSS